MTRNSNTLALAFVGEAKNQSDNLFAEAIANVSEENTVEKLTDFCVDEKAKQDYSFSEVA